MLVAFIATIFILLLIALFMWIGGLSGYKAAVRNLCVVIAVALISLPIAFVIASRVAGNDLFGLKMAALDMAMDYGARGLAAERVVIGTLENATTAIATPMAFIAVYLVLSILAFGAKAIIVAVLHKKHPVEKNTVNTKSRGIGIAVGTVTALLFGMLLTFPLYNLSSIASKHETQLSKLLGEETIGLAASLDKSPSRYVYRFTGTEALGRVFFNRLSGGKLLDEIGRFSDAAGTLTDISDPTGHYTELCRGALEMVDIYFEPGFIAGSESDKFALLNRALKKQISGIDVSMLDKLAKGVNYADRATLSSDLQTLCTLVEILETRDVLDAMLNNFEDGVSVMSSLTAEDTEQVAALLYSLEISDTVARAVLAELISVVSGKEAYVYPKDIDLRGTQDDFAEILATLPRVAKIIEDGVSVSTLDETQRKAFVADVNVLKSSPLLPSEVFTTIQRKVRDAI